MDTRDMTDPNERVWIKKTTDPTNMSMRGTTREIWNDQQKYRTTGVYGECDSHGVLYPEWTPTPGETFCPPTYQEKQSGVELEGIPDHVASRLVQSIALPRLTLNCFTDLATLELIVTYLRKYWSHKEGTDEGWSYLQPGGAFREHLYVPTRFLRDIKEETGIHFGYGIRNTEIDADVDHLHIVNS